MRFHHEILRKQVKNPGVSPEVFQSLYWIQKKQASGASNPTGDELPHPHLRTNYIPIFVTLSGVLVLGWVLSHISPEQDQDGTPPHTDKRIFYKGLGLGRVITTIIWPFFPIPLPVGGADVCLNQNHDNQNHQHLRRCRGTCLHLFTEFLLYRRHHGSGCFRAHRPRLGELPLNGKSHAVPRLASLMAYRALSQSPRPALAGAGLSADGCRNCPDRFSRLPGICAWLYLASASGAAGDGSGRQDLGNPSPGGHSA